jgi:hypothetical protein
MINQAPTKEYFFCKSDNLLRPINVATCHGMSNPKLSSSFGTAKMVLNVYHENTGLSENVIKQIRKRHTPLNPPPSMGEQFNNSPPWRGAVLRRGGCL